MSRRKRSRSPLSVEDFDTDFDDGSCSNSSRNNQSPPMQRNAANARERARMRVLSSAFCRLKTKLPWVPADTKLSKLDTLRLATIYIQQLRASLARDNDSVQQSSGSQFDLTATINNTQHSIVWPFTFQHQSVDIPANRSLLNTNRWLTHDMSNFHDATYISPNAAVSSETSIMKNGMTTSAMLNNTTAHG